MMKKILTLLLLAMSVSTFAQKLETLTVEKIMRDPKWIGVSPSNIHWSDDSRKVYFNWNPENADRDKLFSIALTDVKAVKVSIDEQKSLAAQIGEWNKKHTLKVYEKNGDIYLSEPKSGKTEQLTNTADSESNPTFSGDETKVLFMRGDNLFSLKLSGGELVQLTNFVHAPSSAAPQPGGRRAAQGSAKKVDQSAADNNQERWLKSQQLELFDIINVKHTSPKN